MLFVELAETSRTLARRAARSAKIATLADLLGRLARDEVPVAIAFLSGATRQGRIGVGWAAIRDAATPATAGAATLDIAEVDAHLEALAAIRGRGSAAARSDALRALLSRLTDVEQEFLKHLLLGEMRQGALEAVLVEAVARAASVPATEVRRAVMLAGDAGAVASAVLTRGAAALDDFRIELLRAVQPMLAQPAEDVAAVLAKLERAAFEWKLDGVRVQVHRQGDEVRVFTRAGNDVTHATPELVEAAIALDTDRVILDGEALALHEDGRPHPFQTSMRRFGRKLDVARLREELPLAVFFFDLLHGGGDDWIDRAAAERRDALRALVPAPLVVPGIVTGDVAEAERFLADTLARGHEGVIAKALDAPYAAGRRGAGWLKLKPTHTLDLVVLAAEWGSGRRRGWLSNLHLGARDEEGGDFVMLGKTFKGLTDDLLRWQTERFLQLETSRDRHVVHVEPVVVVEIAFDGVQRSSQYPGGLALRFARVKRYREDKAADEADTIQVLRARFERSA